MKFINSFFKKRIIFYVVFFGSVLYTAFSCEPTVVFEKAMPPDVAPISEIPIEFQGIFLCESDSSLIHIESDIVYQERHSRFITTLERVKEVEGCSIEDGGLYFPWRKACVPFEYITDSLIIATMFETDTLFQFTDASIAKLYKGRLFVNILYEGRDWVTFMVTPNMDGSMLWEIIQVPDQINKIEGITYDYRSRQIDEDNIQYIINPTLVDFEKILARDYTRTCDVLIPIKINN